MIYTVPHYYSRFRCMAAKCPDTCCAGWAIMIDDRSMRRYRDIKGPFGNRLHSSIRWREGVFRQYHGRCAFLNEDNLCDIYTEAGPEYLCETCRTYPRHIEEFEGSREISLCLSCIEAARIILGCEEPVGFITREDEKEETYEEFDFFLYTKLMDAREVALDILRDRAFSSRDRVSLCLGLAHDLQARIRKERLYETDDLLERYRRKDRFERLGFCLARYHISGVSRYEVMKALYSLLSEMEALDPLWPEFAVRMKDHLYGEGPKGYDEQRRAFEESGAGRSMSLHREQLMVYFVFTYFCGAVYDGNPYGKMKMAAASSLIIEELALALWIRQGGDLSFMDFVDVAHRFSREIEHSDHNKALLEAALVRRPEFSLEHMLCAVNSNNP